MRPTYCVFTLALISGASQLLTGCAHDYSVEPTFGLSVSQAIQQQTIKPGGAGVDGVSPGLDGEAAKATIERYHKSYTSPPQLGNVMMLGVGSGADVGSIASGAER